MNADDLIAGKEQRRCMWVAELTRAATVAGVTPEAAQAVLQHFGEFRALFEWAEAGDFINGTTTWYGEARRIVE